MSFTELDSFPPFFSVQNIRTSLCFSQKLCYFSYPKAMSWEYCFNASKNHCPFRYRPILKGDLAKSTENHFQISVMVEIIQFYYSKAKNLQNVCILEWAFRIQFI